MSIFRTGRLLPVGALLLGFLAMGRCASASVLGFEPFQYSTGALAGQAGGQGFTGAWANGPVTGSPDAVVSPGLPQNNGTGNAFKVGSGLGSLHEYTRPFSPVTANGSVTWLRFLLRADTIPSANNPAGGIGFTGSGATPFIGLGDTTGGIYVSQYKVGPPSVLAASHIAAGQTFDLLARITLAAGNDTVDLWVNRDPNALPAPDVTNNQLNFTISSLNPAAFDNAVVTIDEIRLGTTLADVPEPSTAALLLPVAVVALRRRHAQAQRTPCGRAERRA